ncbi:MAG: hypothetical protein EA397_03130 [Deltaproteobacteria bacterium]|nr:MAG: hypothetical protein EA397_03130 [Deltaproteobacteria bacterium]
MSASELVLELGALLIYGNAIVLVHELGHAAMARPSGLKLSSFGIGTGPPVFRLTLPGEVVLYLGRWPLGGSCAAVPWGPDRSSRWLFHAGGLIAQGALMLVLLALPSGWWIDRAIPFNLLVLGTNLLPWRWGPFRSDGAALLERARGTTTRQGLIGQRERLIYLLRRERALDSRLGIAHTQTVLAWAELQAGQRERADELLEETTALVRGYPWLERLHVLVSAELLREQDRPLEALRTLRALPRAESRNADDLFELTCARAKISLGDLEGARAALLTLADREDATGHQARVLLLRTLLSEPEALAEATARALPRLRRPLLDPLDAVASLRMAADALHRHGLPRRSAQAIDAATDLERLLRGATESTEEGMLLERIRRATRSVRLGQAPHPEGATPANPALEANPPHDTDRPSTRPSGQ